MLDYQYNAIPTNVTDISLKISLLSLIEEYILQIQHKTQYISEIDRSFCKTMPKWVCDTFKEEHLNEINSLKTKILLAKLLLEEL